MADSSSTSYSDTDTEDSLRKRQRTGDVVHVSELVGDAPAPESSHSSTDAQPTSVTQGLTSAAHWRVRGASYWRQSLSLADAGCMPLCAGLDSTQERHRVEGRILHLLFRGRQGPACRGMQATEQPFGPCTNDHL